MPWSYSIIFVHGLKGHPRNTWEASSGGSQKDNTGSARKNHGFLSSIFGSKKSSEAVRGESDQGIFWIEDFLPEDLPNARILTYGYNADVIGGLFQANNKNSISQHGRDLKAKLERDLENEVNHLACRWKVEAVDFSRLPSYLSHIAWVELLSKTCVILESVCSLPHTGPIRIADTGGISFRLFTGQILLASAQSW